MRGGNVFFDRKLFPTCEVFSKSFFGMARRTFSGSSSICRDLAPIGSSGWEVALAAGNLFVRSGQRKRRILFMVERRTIPIRRGVACTAVRDYAVPVELTGMYILMAPRACLRGGTENHVVDAGLGCRRPMAVQTSDALVSALQRKGCSRVIESRRLAPRLLCMAGRTA